MMQSSVPSADIGSSTKKESSTPKTPSSFKPFDKQLLYSSIHQKTKIAFDSFRTEQGFLSLFSRTKYNYYYHQPKQQFPMKVTSRQYFLITFSLFLLTLFSPQTIVIGSLTLFFLGKYFKEMFRSYRDLGIISLLPENIKTQLLNRSLFDILCDFWFMQWLSIAKICLKPFMNTIQPDNAVQVLNDLSENIRQKFLVKGVLNILPENYKRAVFPATQTTKNSLVEQVSHSPEQKKRYQRPFPISHRFMKPQDDDTSSTFSFVPTMKKVCSYTSLSNEIDLESPLLLSREQSIISIETKKKPSCQKWDKLEFYKLIKNQLESGGIIKTTQNVISMVRKLMELKNFSQNVQKINSSHIAKVMIFFWLAVLIQVRMSPHARRMIFKTIYLISGVLSVLGALSTTGVLIYKYSNLETQSSKTTKKRRNLKY